MVWLTKEEAVDGEVGDKAGWYDDTEFTYEDEAEFDIGSGFKTSLGSKNVSFIYSGQVYDQAFTIDCKNKKYVIIIDGDEYDTFLDLIDSGIVELDIIKNAYTASYGLEERISKKKSSK